MISKADGRPRPLGIAAVEDKILQRAVVEVLNSIYEQDFLGFSYGFRPGRSQHDALDALAVAIKRRKVNWVLDADIRDLFGSLDRSWLLKFLGHRIADKRVLRLIQKWLGAGVIEDGEWSDSEQGTVREHRYRRCSRMCTSTTFWTSGHTNGDAATRTGTSWSCGGLTTSSWALSTGRTPSGSWPTCARDSRSLRWS